MSFALAPETCGAPSCVVDLVPEICDAPLPVPLILLQGHAMFPFRAVYLVPETCDVSSFVSLTSLEAHDAFFPHREFPFPTSFPLPLRRPAATLFESLQMSFSAPAPISAESFRASRRAAFRLQAHLVFYMDSFWIRLFGLQATNGHCPGKKANENLDSALGNGT